MFQLLICLCAIGLGFLGCKNKSDSPETTTSAVETRVPDATTYNPFSSGIGARNSTLPLTNPPSKLKGRLYSRSH